MGLTSGTETLWSSMETLVLLGAWLQVLVDSWLVSVKVLHGNTDMHVKALVA